MIVVGGESGSGLLDGVQVREHFLFWNWKIYEREIVAIYEHQY